ncbi:enoyl-CoA hydratase/isomerase family protein [Alicyclobacillus dauci]|uniref:Enoyl-CoA hydratase n=1 Tax=Alicyclobacillus dauci TaxID=1475485 RepID=A0ABY6YXF5_9BACL|nr:enoyl-CoA hydratase [Alicyclobacillus dauci]WAH35295.1 enoyl-CoA hydratase [Alicyclobacillus dauci]
MDNLLIQDAQGVRILTLNRPDRLNAFDDGLSSNLIQALNDASRDDDVRVVIITGRGRGFSSGLDLSTFTNGDLSPTSRFGRLDELEWVGRLIESVVHNDKPIIAAINGVAAGAGLSLALACDFRFMSEEAKLTTGYIRRALSPDAGMTYFLPRLVGHTKAMELILTGRDVDAAEADRLGLLNQVVEGSQLLETVQAFARELASGPPIAMTLSKRLVYSSYDTPLVPQLKNELAFIRQCFGTDDVREGIQAMMEKRKPNFQGR